MAKTTVAGDAVVVTSALTLEDIKKVEKFNPEALILRGGKDGNDPIFAIATGPCGLINEFGATFSKATEDGGFATITLVARNGIPGDAKKWVAEEMGGAILRLNKLEQQVAAAAAAVYDDLTKVMVQIEVVQ